MIGVIVAVVDEARTAASLNHPNPVKVHDAGEDDGGLFLVTELIEEKRALRI